MDRPKLYVQLGPQRAYTPSKLTLKFIQLPIYTVEHIFLSRAHRRAAYHFIKKKRKSNAVAKPAPLFNPIQGYALYRIITHQGRVRN